MRLKGFSISLILIFFYGITPYIYINLLEFGKSDLEEATKFGLVYSFATICAILIVNKFRLLHFGKISNNSWLTIRQAKSFYFILFLFCSISFFLNPWNENRIGVFASVSALFRILWIAVSIPLLKTDKSKYIIALSCILMFIDGSRTFVFIIFLFFLNNNLVRKSIIASGFVLVLLTASFRNGFYSFDLLYGIFGEGVNGSSGIFQVMQIQNEMNDFPYFQHILYTFFQPILSFFSLFLPSSLIDFDSSQFLGNLVNKNLGESYYPMGGFYILSEFVGYGYWGILLFLIYFFGSIKFTSFLLDSNSIKFSPALIFMLIKSSPHTYWNWVIWFFIIGIALKLFFKMLKYE